MKLVQIENPATVSTSRKVRKLPPLLEKKLKEVMKRNTENGTNECGHTYHDWNNGGYSIYNDRG